MRSFSRKCSNGKKPESNLLLERSASPRRLYWGASGAGFVRCDGERTIIRKLHFLQFAINSSKTSKPWQGSIDRIRYDGAQFGSRFKGLTTLGLSQQRQREKDV